MPMSEWSRHTKPKSNDGYLMIRFMDTIGECWEPDGDFVLAFLALLTFSPGTIHLLANTVVSLSCMRF